MINVLHSLESRGGQLPFSKCPRQIMLCVMGPLKHWTQTYILCTPDFEHSRRGGSSCALSHELANASMPMFQAGAPRLRYPSSDHLRLEHSEAEREAAADIAQRFAVEICDLLRRMPRALLLLLKTNDCLRSVDYALGTVRFICHGMRNICLEI